MGGRLDLPDSSSSVPLILRWVALILPRAQALREPRGRVGGRRVWDGAGSGRLGWGRSSIIQIYTPASFENRTQRGSSREKARNPAESLALARLHPMEEVYRLFERRYRTATALAKAGAPAGAVEAFCPAPGGVEEAVRAGPGEGAGVPGREVAGSDVERRGAREPSVPEDAEDGVPGADAACDRGSAGVGPASRTSGPRPSRDDQDPSQGEGSMMQEPGILATVSKNTRKYSDKCEDWARACGQNLGELRKEGIKARVSRLIEHSTMYRHSITNEHWVRIAALLPGQAGDPGVTAKDNRLFVDAVLWIAKTGAPWRDLPERFGNWEKFADRHGFCRSGHLYPPRDAEIKRFCSQQA